MIADSLVLDPNARYDIFSQVDGTELEVISVNILYGLLKSDSGLSMRFFRHLARKLAIQLRNLHPTSIIKDKKEEESDGEEEEDTLEKTETNQLDAHHKKTDNKEEDLIKKFDLPTTEILLRTIDAVKVTQVLNQVGKIHLFQEHICFESSIFGRDKLNTYTMDSIADVVYDPKKSTLVLDLKGKKVLFIDLRDGENFSKLLTSVWREVKQQKNNKSVKKPKRVPVKDSISLTDDDRNLLVNAGTTLTHFKDGEYMRERTSNCLCYCSW